MCKGQIIGHSGDTAEGGIKEVTVSRVFQVLGFVSDQMGGSRTLGRLSTRELPCSTDGRIVCI